VSRLRAARKAVVILLTDMRRRSTALGLAALAAALLTGISAASSSPTLLSAKPSHGHVVAVFTLGDTESSDLVPGHIAVATAPSQQATGSFAPADVRFQESVSSPTRVATGYRIRTQHKLRPGRYWVKVSGVVIGLDCTPHKPCKELWSNARRVIIPRP